ncbi:pentapeptide repeat-containing protein [Gephyromycinifex aptenodytis]|uniref:pentapeptide repeat-containing protein n=1 Tax=Gephyromycinifex aptenodytis TaxID=2716227 RepID=UPI0014488D35|nr:pentapeptide repeat-containing protein [Gephyromycinifex aptenodytis]
MLNSRTRLSPTRAARRVSPNTRGWIVVALVSVLVVGLLWSAFATVRRAEQALQVAQEARGQAHAAQAAAQEAQRSSRAEVFTGATRSLGAADIEERLGAVHTLHALATTAGPQSSAACETLTSFVQRRAPAMKAPVGPDITTALSALARDCHGARRFTGLDLSGADFNDGALRGMSLRSCNLSKARLRSADLSGARFVGTSLAGADLRYADLRGATLYAVDLSGAKLAAARLDGVRYDKATTWPNGFTPPAPAEDTATS